jgi:hypothetical protein
LFIDGTGFVGIGTTPTIGYGLDVRGLTRLLTVGGSSGLEIGLGTTTNQSAYLDLVGDTTYSDYGLRIIRNSTGENATSVITQRGTGELSIQTSEAAPLTFFTANTERLRIDSTGNVGIGTASPAQALDLGGGNITLGSTLFSGTDVSTGDVTFEHGGNRTGSGNAIIDLHAVSGSDFQSRILRDSGANGALSIVNNGTGNFIITQANAAAITFGTDNLERARIDSSGKFLVGTNTASGSALLQVAGDAQIQSLNGGALAGFRNRIINGDMRIAQRGTSFAAITSQAYSLDRWIWGQNGAMACTVSQSSDVPNDTFQSSYKVDVTTVDTSIATGDFADISQSIEGYNVRDLIGTTFTVSFWVKSPKTGVHCVAFRNAGPTPDRSHIKEYTVTTANTWEYKTLTVSGGLITTGTWDWTNGAGLLINFTLTCGTTFQTTADTWQTGNFIATANQVNVMDNTSNDFFLTGVQLEPGSVATPFERRPIGTELALCQRYFCQQRAHAQSPAIGFTIVPIYFPVAMRATPTTANIALGSSADAVAFALTVTDPASAYFQIQATVADGYVINRIDAYSAEL